ncbi:MAG: Fe-S cluster assembly protein SufD [Gemmatimonadota bacterium]|nr:Fe-S cluster assembly protein SufD [Gemmatimonadota bacterium]MDH5198038.1 Fe-S cluster assembly protein SufD [Gemmatimonadota bacterium]
MTAVAVERVAERTAPYVTAHEEFVRASAGPAWLQDLRQEAITRFAAVGFPTTRDEAWRFTSVERVAAGRFSAPPSGIPAGVREAVARVVVGEPHERLVATFVNGRFTKELSTLVGLPSGVVVGSLADAMRSHGDLVRTHLGRYASAEANPFTALSTAFVADGAFVYVPRNVVVEQPLQIVFVSSGGEEPIVSQTRALFVLEESAQLSLIEQYVGAGEGTYWTNAVTEWVVGDNAVVDAYRIQRERTDASHTATTWSRQGRSSVFSAVNFAFGGHLCRHDIHAVLDGEGAECTVNGLSVLRGNQLMDHHTTIDHAKPHCNSWELFNGVYDERARGVFTGRIIVRPGAQKTDSKQTSNSLLLSEDARSDSQPQLEIYADDVKCTHGATLGPIDEKSLFYLQSRGIGGQAARNLLTYGFGAEILNSVSLEPLRAHLDDVVHARLENRAH